MDIGAKPKKLRSFLVEDILGLEKNDTEANCRSHYSHQDSATHLADSKSPFSNSTNNYQYEESSKSYDFEWQGETLFHFLHFWSISAFMQFIVLYCNF